MIPVIPIVMLFVVARALSKKIHRKNVARGSSVLLATYGSPYMTETHRGQSGKLYYSVVASLGDIANPTAANSGVIYRVDLPFATKVHLVCIPKQDTQIDMTRTYLEPVTLEGDFPQYVALYAESGQQANARYVLDPKAMQFILDFCMTHSWEILGDQLILLHTDSSHDQDIEAVMATINGFLANIRPALEVPIDEGRQVARAAYGQERRSLRCPICLTTMQYHEQRYFSCPKGHGVLAYGSAVAAIRNRSLSINLPLGPSVLHAQLKCPACLTAMTKTLYASTDVEIDSCQSCPYRWLDVGEIEALKLPDRLAQLDIGQPLETVFVEAPNNDISRAV